MFANCSAVGLMAAFSVGLSALAATSVPAQSSSPTALPSPGVAAAAPAGNSELASPSKDSDRRHAAKLFLSAGKLFAKEKFEEAMRAFEQAAALDPSNSNYRLAADLARSHAVTALIQAAAKDRLRGDAGAARVALEKALALDPRNIQVTEHLHEMGDDALQSQTTALTGLNNVDLIESVALMPTAGTHSFHLRTDQRQAIQQVFKSYGLEATVDESVRPTQIRLDLDDASFDQAVRALGLLTGSFNVPLDAHRALVARDTPENRQQWMRLDLETVYLSGLSTTELNDMVTLAKNVFDAQPAVAEPSAGTLTIRAPLRNLNAFNATIRELLDGRSQVMLEVRLIQIAHTNQRNTGIQPPQSVSAFNVYAEEQSILNTDRKSVV